MFCCACSLVHPAVSKKPNLFWLQQNIWGAAFSLNMSYCYIITCLIFISALIIVEFMPVDRYAAVSDKSKTRYPQPPSVPSSKRKVRTEDISVWFATFPGKCLESYCGQFGRIFPGSEFSHVPK